MARTEEAQVTSGTTDPVPADCQGQNVFTLDPDFAALAHLYLDEAEQAHFLPRFEQLGAIAGGELDALARTADRHPPVLQRRTPQGRDEDRIEYHPAFRAMEKIAYERFGLHAASHRGGVLDWPGPLSPVAKYALTYLFVQGEFGLMCPASLCDTSAFMVDRFAPPAVRERYLPRMLAERCDDLWTGTQWMTERGWGSDVSGIEVAARPDPGAPGQWRIEGDKWFCSSTDADIILLLARSGAPEEGNRGLSLFLVPRRLEDGRRNRYAIVRLKDKLGTRSMATGEVRFEGAVGYLLGEEGRGLRHVMDQVTLSRLSHGVRAAAMMRRCLNEARVAADGRIAFGRSLTEQPLMRRQLDKMALRTEQALSAWLFTAQTMAAAEAGDEAAAARLRLLTPLIKFRACRDNIPVATAAMEVRGGNGFIEDWATARLVRDAHTGVLWEGTSSIVAIDVLRRAVAGQRTHEALGEELARLLDQAAGAETAPDPTLRQALADGLADTLAFADRVVAAPDGEALAREVAGALYHATTAIVMAWESAMTADLDVGARRRRLAADVLRHRLRPLLARVSLELPPQAFSS